MKQHQIFNINKKIRERKIKKFLKIIIKNPFYGHKGEVTKLWLDLIQMKTITSSPVLCQTPAGTTFCALCCWQLLAKPFLASVWVLAVLSLPTTGSSSENLMSLVGRIWMQCTNPILIHHKLPIWSHVQSSLLSTLSHMSCTHPACT